VHAVLAVVFLSALLGWALRRDSRQPVRALIVTAFVLVTGACMYRVRADTWTDDSLVNGDRYFYISRVLVAWLVVLELDAKPRLVAWAARGLCLLGVLMHVPYFSVPALPDYKWAQHCEPIRQGTPANIYTLPEGWFIEYPGRPNATPAAGR
jgi:peptidoglycan/LPS O-acetylase OafA/YrhL